MASEEEKTRRALVELRIYEGSAKDLETRLEIVNAAMTENAMAFSTLEGVKSQSAEAQTLIPVGAGSYIQAKLSDVSKIVVSVGAGVAVEKPIEDSISDIKNRLAELQQARMSLQEQLRQILLKIEENRRSLDEIARRGGGGAVTIL